jgi:hypothetical protein
MHAINRFTIAALLSITLGIFVHSPVQAACSDADNCSTEECNKRQAKVHPTCDQPRSCSNISASRKSELKKRLGINQACLAARMDVAACFSTTDSGHQDAIDDVKKAIKKCQDKI